MPSSTPSICSLQKTIVVHSLVQNPCPIVYHLVPKSHQLPNLQQPPLVVAIKRTRTVQAWCNSSLLSRHSAPTLLPRLHHAPAPPLTRLALCTRNALPLARSRRLCTKPRRSKLRASTVLTAACMADTAPASGGVAAQVSTEAAPLSLPDSGATAPAGPCQDFSLGGWISFPLIIRPHSLPL